MVRRILTKKNNINNMIIKKRTNQLVDVVIGVGVASFALGSANALIKSNKKFIN